ncbi:transcriptional regulator, partial [Salmonella enterica subsp. enterica serovar Kentucky]|nr:transcriptional regulator [Salmonella enterica subsp. enterica serovar Kentucky]
LYWFFMTSEEESDMKSAIDSKTVLNERQKKLLFVFDQLPEEEQDRFISLAATRLDELDRFMAEYLKRRKIEPPPE